MIYQHFGLYFNEDQLNAAREKREQETDLDEAWRWLLARPGDTIREAEALPDADEQAEPPEPLLKPQLDEFARVVEAALRYRITGSDNAAQFANRALEASYGLSRDASLLIRIQQSMAGAQVFEMLRDHPGCPATWRDQFAAQVADLLNTQQTPTALEQAWQMALGIVAGIVLDDEALVESGAAAYRQIIDSIHPEGYLRAAVQPQEEGASPFMQQLLSVAALSLAAEAAAQQGIDLWAYENRGVGAMTAASYIIYYYFFPDKWRWNEEFTTEDTARIFREHGAFVGILSYRGQPRGLEYLLPEQRPLFGACYGGLTSLTHFGKAPQKKKRRGWIS